MTNYRKIKSMNIEDLASFLDNCSSFENAPWTIWFNQTYCENCESITCKYESELLGESGKVECAYCELEHKCKFFLHFDDIPSPKEICKLWLKKGDTDESKNNY